MDTVRSKKGCTRDLQWSRLIDVLSAKLLDLSGYFWGYDTAPTEGGITNFYGLPKSVDYMILLLQAGSDLAELWTRSAARKDAPAIYSGPD